MSAHIHSAQSGNQLLNQLSSDEYQALDPHIESVQLSVREAAYKRNREFRFVYFPVSCVMSVITPMRNERSVEVVSVGNEGFTGCELLIGASVAVENCICQVPGQSLRMPAATFQQAVNGDTPLRRITRHYMRAYIRQLAQAVVCNRAHSTEERFARWVLTMRDRAGSDHFTLNDEFLGYMLGESQSTINLVMNTFEHAGLIRYDGGYITLLDSAKMTKISCDCYGAIASLLH